MSTYRRLVSFAGSSIGIETQDAQGSDLVAWLYRDLPAGGEEPPGTMYHLLPGDVPGQSLLYREDTLIYRGESLATLAAVLLGDSCRQLAEQSRGGPLFHAGAVAWRSKGILLPGKIRAGKTTLVAWLTTRGFDYLTDEMALIPNGTVTVHSFTRPLNLKGEAISLLREQIDGASWATLRNPASWLVTPTALKADNQAGDHPLGIIIFPHYRPKGGLEQRRLSKAQAGLALAQSLVNSRNLPERGFPEIIRLARAIPAYTLTYTDLDQAGDWIESLL